jgi:YVTN family beta-propeller protein
MSSNAPARALVSAAVIVLAACSDTGSNAPMQEETSSTGAPLYSASGSNGCGPKAHPVGTILGTVTAPFPWGVAVRDDGLTYFTELFDGGVGITNTVTRQITGFIATGSLPTGIAFSPDGLRSYVANQGDNTVSVIDVGTGQVIGTVSDPASPFSVEVSPDGSQFYVGNNDNTLLIVDAQTLQITKTLTVGSATNAFVVDPAGRMLYASAFVDGTVSEIDIFTGNLLRTFNVGGTPQGMAINHKGTHLYVANEEGYLNDIDLTTGQAGNQIPLAGGGFGVGVTPDDHEAWIAIPGAGQVQVFNLQQRRITGSLNVGGDPRRLAFSAQGKIGAITNAAGYVTFVK